MKEKFIQLQQLLDCTCGLQMACVPRSREAVIELFRSSADPVFDVLLKNDDSYVRQILELPTDEDTIYEFSTSVGIVFFTYTPRDEIYLFGPVLTEHYSLETVLQNLSPYEINEHMQHLIVQFISSLPVIPAERLFSIVQTCLRQLFYLERPLKITQASTFFSLENMLRSSLPHLTPEISQMRQIEIRYEHGTALIEAIKQGNVSLAFHLVGEYVPGSDTTVRNKNPLRNAQNYCIIFNTQLRHAMEECGIHPYRVDQLSNEIGMQIEQITEVSKLKDFFAYMIRQYCRMVQKHAYTNLNPLTNLAVEYIKEHLSENLTVKETAQALTVNANYLSAQFHEHMGISFIDFVNQERVHQAAALLGHTHLQIQQISQIVGYNNTSYFSKQFARFMGTSPRQYRHQHNPNA